MFAPDSYQIIAELFPRLLGILYFFAFAAFIPQIRGLLGENGILPVRRYLTHVRRRLGSRSFYWVPSVFWCNASDGTLSSALWLGTALSLLLVMGFAPWVLLPLLIVLHLSLISIGQDFLSFGWEGLLLEVAYNGMLLSFTATPNIFVWINLNFLIFRFHFQAGICKLQSGEPTWRDLTALCHHYETQPLPNPLSWHFHQLPALFHKCSVLAVLFIEIFVPAGVFGDESARLVTCLLLFSLQLAIGISGNYSYLTLLTVLLITPLLNDASLSFLSVTSDHHAAASHGWEAAAAGGGALLLLLQGCRLWHQLFPNRLFDRLFFQLHPYHLANSYGVFASMTTERYEVVVEGSDDNELWQEYLFRYKPSETTRRPRQIAPFQPRLDWQAWFLPFRSYQNQTWFQNFLYRVLEGRPEVLKLLRFNPFPDKPPRFLRAQIYLYRFTDKAAKAKTGHWWTRELIGPYSPTIEKK